MAYFQHSLWGDDIREIFNMYNQSKLAGISPIMMKKFGERIYQKQLNPEAEDGLRLPETLGFDGKPICSKRSPKNYLTYDSTHVFSPKEDIVRMGLFFSLPLEWISVLLIKRDWEIYFLREIKGWRSGNGASARDMIFGAETDHVREADRGFLGQSSDRQSFYHEMDDYAKAQFHLLESHWKLASTAGYDVNGLKTLIAEIVGHRLYHSSIASHEIQEFFRKMTERLKILWKGSIEQQQVFWIRRLKWISAQEELADIQYRIENQRLVSKEVERRWLTQFGAEEMDLINESYKRENLKRRINYKRANPKLSEKEILETVRAEEEEAEKRRTEFEKWVILSPHLVKINEGGWETGGLAHANIEREECKHLMREFWLLTHPDRLENQPAYKNLSPEQKEYLKVMFLKSLEIQPEELGFPPSHLNHDFRSRQGLMRAIDEVKAVLEWAGLKLNATYDIPKGKPLKDQIIWLKSETKRLEDAIAACRSELYQLQTDPEFKRRRNILFEDTKEIFDKIKNALTQKIIETRTEADGLTSQYRRLFNVKNLQN